MRARSIILLFPLASIVSGCSLFGIATKGDFETHTQEQALEQAALQTKLRSLQIDLGSAVAQLTALRDEIQPRMLALSEEVDDLERFYAESRQDLESVSALLSNAQLQVGILEQDFGRVRVDLVAVRDSVGVVSAGMTSLQTTATASAELATRAQREAQSLRQTYFEELQAERERLTLRLSELEHRLRQFADATLPQ